MKVGINAITMPQPASRQRYRPRIANTREFIKGVISEIAAASRRYCGIPQDQAKSLIKTVNVFKIERAQVAVNAT